MVLESIKAEPGFASRVTAFNGRYVSLPEAASTAITVHLIHGGEGPVIDPAHVVAAQETLISAGGDVTLDIMEDLDRATDNRSIQPVLDRLHYTIPRHYSDEALSGGKPGGDNVIEMTQ